MPEEHELLDAKVVFFTLLDQEIEQLITQHAPPGFAVSMYSHLISDEEKRSIVMDADFLLLFPGEISSNVLRAASRLKLIQLISAGYDDIDLETCQQLGIPVVNNGGSNSIDVAEHTLALILSYYRRIREHDEDVRNGIWNIETASSSCYTIYGKTVGIIGFGNIGKKVAELLSGFGTNVIYNDELQASVEIERSLQATYTGLESLIGESDIISLHVPLTDDTRHLIGSREISWMRPQTLFVNTCRGEVVDEAALVQALEEKRILGAALDVLQKEPPEISSPLLTLDNVLLTPHVAGLTRETWARRGRFAFGNMQRVLNGEPALGLIKPP